MKLDDSMVHLEIEDQEFVHMEIMKANDDLLNHTGFASDLTGWVDWPLHYDVEEIRKIKNIADEIKEKAELFIIIGIGGSYLGAKAAMDLLGTQKNGPEIYFIGNNLSSGTFSTILDLVKEKETYVNMISKSGETLESALAFRFIKQIIEEHYGNEVAQNRIIVTTDEEKGSLKQLATDQNYRTLTVPHSIGGRFSILTSVGLLPMAVAGIDVDQVLEGAKNSYYTYNNENIMENDCFKYALYRNMLYRAGKKIELFVHYEPELNGFAEWWKQLFGESEGKEHKGIFPANANFTTDLHSLGQYIQEGEQIIFTTTLWVEESSVNLMVPFCAEDYDGLNYLSGKSLHFINEKVCEGAMQAHYEGGVSCLKIMIPKLTPFYFGELVYFFEKSCAISGFLLGVDPFNQPGVEAYKQNTSTLLKK